MADQKTYLASKFTSLRSTRPSKGSSWPDNWKGAQNEEHCVQGYDPDGVHRYRSLMQFSLGSLSDTAQILKAELHIFTATDHPGLKTDATKDKTNIKVAVAREGWSETGGGEKVWTGATDPGDSDYNDTYRAYGKVTEVGLHETVINVMPLVRYWAPTSVKDNTGKKCLGKPNHGLVMVVAGGGKDEATGHETVVASPHHANTSIRPFLVLTVNLKGGPGVVIQSGPNGNIPSGTPQFFEGEYEPGRTGDKMTAVQIKRTGGGLPELVWTTTPSANDVAASTFAVPVPASWPLLTTFNWAARVKNTKDEWTPWTGTLPVRWTGTPPDLSLPQPDGQTLDSLISVWFRVRATVPATRYRAYRWRIQLRTQTEESDPAWDDDPLWDTGPMTVPLSADEMNPVVGATVIQNLSTLYGGPTLSPGSYSWRVMAEDVFGAESPWTYAAVEVTEPYVPSPGDVVNLTGYAKRPPHRIRIFGMGANRGPGKLLAELTDAAHVGASEFYNAAGEFFFTLPAIHPQVSVIEPYQCHYSLELHTGEGWRPKAYGLITDFDATEDEVVFYGQDYLGLLARAMEERFDPTNAELPTDKGGAKYVKKTISYIITDQLNKAKAMANSPVGFISVGDIATISEQVTIYASFKQRLTFIAGLIESARAGTGRRTRLVCERAANGTFRWRLLLDPGVTRDALRMEYGGLVQGFRTVPFGNWGTSVASVGRTALGTKVYSAIATAPGVPEATYGHWPSATMYSDIDDLNDLRRRTAQAATRTAKVGKQLGLGLRVGSVAIKDGWDICDSVPVRIKRGVVDTTRFGSGYWTIWGWTWNSFPDGHDALTLSLSPREDQTPPNPDLIPSKPIYGSLDWQVGYGVPTTWSAPPSPTPPPVALRAVAGRSGPVALAEGDLPLSEELVIAAHYEDLNTGCIYDLDTDEESPTFEEYLLVSCPSPGPEGPPGPPGPAGGGIISIGRYRWDQVFTPPPGTGRIGVEDQPPVVNMATHLLVHETDQNDADRAPYLGNLKVGDTVVIDDGSGNVWAHKVTAPPTDLGTTWSIPILYDPRAGSGSIPLQPAEVICEVSLVRGEARDTVPPDAPTGLVLSNSFGQTPDGVLRANILAAWNPNSEDDLSHYEVGYNFTASNDVPKGWDVQAVAGTHIPAGVYRIGVTAAGASSGETSGLTTDVEVTEATTADIQVTGLDLINLTPSLKPEFNIYIGLVGGDGTAVMRQVAAGVTGSNYLIQSVPTTGPTMPGSSTAINYAYEIIQLAASIDEATNRPFPSDIYNDARPKTFYSVRVRAVDLSNNRSEPSASATITTFGDNEAPAIPTGILATNGNKRIGLAWVQTQTPDLDHFEVRWRQVGATDWEYLAVYATYVIVEVPLNRLGPDDEEGVAYEGNVRAVDRSGNVNISHTPGEEEPGVAPIDDLDAGWSDPWEALSLPTAPEDIAVETLFANYAYLIELTADQIKGGNLEIREDTDSPGAITIYDTQGRLAGRWSPYGWFIIDVENPTNAIRGKNSRIDFTDSGIPGQQPWQWPESVWGTAINAQGINASIITTGGAPGGANRLLNSGFELAPAVTTGFYLYDTAAEWDAPLAAPAAVNKTAGAVALTQTNYAVP